MKSVVPIALAEMKPWDVWNWKFPDAGEHPAVILATEDRVGLSPKPEAENHGFHG